MDEKMMIEHSSNNAPSVSVVIPFFNAEAYFRETIESVLNQDYADWELILVDDGSADESTQIAKEYANQHPDRIFYAEHDGHRNRAAAATRNLGIAKARGEIVAFLDADDVWLPEYLRHQVETLRANPRASMICQATKYWHNWSDSSAKNVEIEVGARSERLYEPPQLVKELYPLAEGAAPCTCGIIVKKSALVRIGGFEESFVGKSQVFEDQAFLIKIYLREPVYISSACANLYRQRPGSVMDTTATEGYYDDARRFFLEWLENYLQKEKIVDREVQKLLQKAFRPFRHPIINRISNGISHRLKRATAQFYR